MQATQLPPFSIRIFLPDGDPDGLRIIEKSNWTGIGVVFTRTGYKAALRRDEFERTGVYVLVGSLDDSSLPTVYIGEGDPVRPRLENHNAKKDFWDWGVFFVTKDMNLNKAHVKYLESRLIELATAAKQCNLDNTNNSSQPNLAEADIADMESFLADMLKVFPLVGLSVFEEPTQQDTSQHELLFIKAKGIVASGYETTKGFVVLKGSQAVIKEVPSIDDYLVTLRRDLAAKGVLAESNGHYLFTENYLFKSPSTAAGVIQALSANGRTCWRNRAGKNLKTLQTSNSTTT